jgi:hypothetical protein
MTPDTPTFRGVIFSQAGVMYYASWIQSAADPDAEGERNLEEHDEREGGLTIGLGKTMIICAKTECTTTDADCRHMTAYGYLHRKHEESCTGAQSSSSSHHYSFDTPKDVQAIATGIRRMP